MRKASSVCREERGRVHGQQVDVSLVLGNLVEGGQVHRFDLRADGMMD